MSALNRRERADGCATYSRPLFQVFVGNVDNDGTKTNLFDPPVIAQYIRVIPVVCRKACTLRMELVGCELNGKRSSTRFRRSNLLGAL